MRPWNVLATAHEGYRDVLMGRMRRHGDFGGGGYRNLAVGHVDDPIAFMDAVRDALPSDRALSMSLARILPIDVVTRFDPADPAGSLAAASEPLWERLGGGTFFVRVERRGLRGHLHSSVVERAIGERVWEFLAARGGTPRVAFADADAILAVETLGEHAGITVVTRALRDAYPFVRVR